MKFDTIEISYNDSFTVNFLYNCVLGRVLLKILINPVVSKIAGFVLDGSFSKIFISGFVKRNNINMNEYKEKKYKSYNDFFSREIKKEFRPFPDNENELAAPCDGKLTSFLINRDSAFKIKKSMYTIESLLKDESLAADFINGTALIFRLTTDDYHRYSYIDNGQILYRKKIKGVLHTVRPIALNRYKVFSQNTREYEVMQTEHFGKVIQIEIGALFVGCIKNHEIRQMFKRGDEKGMFEFGGSTIIMLFQKNRVKIDETIFENTQNNRETIVKTGQKIGNSLFSSLQNV